jgi:hypothetical protein
MTTETLTPSPMLRRVPYAELWLRVGRNWEAFVAVLLAVVTIRPVYQAAAAALDLPWYPTGDWAVLAMRIADVGHNTPLLGPYSRFGWNHPGPLLYWMLAVPYNLLGGRSVDLLAGSGLFACAVTGAILAIAWRRGRLPLVALTSVALAVLVHSMGPSMLRDPWNPYVTLLPLVLFVFLAWSGAEGDRWSWPVLLLTGSFLVQSHVGYTVTVFAVSATAFALAWQRRQTIPLVSSDRRKRQWFISSLVVVAITCWLPVLIDQFAGSGNLGAIGSYFLSGSDSPAGFGTALGQAARHLAAPNAPWLGALEPAGLDGALPGSSALNLVVPVIAFGLAAFSSWQLRCGSAFRLQVLVGVLALTGVVATSRITGPLFGYLVRWWWIVACLWWLSIAWSLLSSASRALPISDALRRFAPVALGMVCLLTVIQTGRNTTSQISAATAPGPSATAILGQLLPTVETELAGSGPVIVKSNGSVWGSYADAVRLDLERHGVQVVVEDSESYRFGDHRSITARTPTATVWVVNADAAWFWRGHSDVKLLASWDPLTPEERVAYFAEEFELAQQLTAAGRPDLAEALATGGGNADTEGSLLADVDQELLQRVESTRRRGDPVSIYLGPPPA